LSKLNSPLTGRVRSGFAGTGSVRSKIVAGAVLVGLVPFLLTTFAANVTVGTGPLQFGQGSEQAISCDSTVYASVAEDWYSQPTPTDSSAGYFRVSDVAISGIDLVACAGLKLRVRLIGTDGKEIPVDASGDATILQIKIPNTDSPVSTSDVQQLNLGYLTPTGVPVSTQVIANVSLNVTGTSVYDGSNLAPNSGDVIFYPDPAAAQVNIDASTIGRVTVETISDPSPKS